MNNKKVYEDKIKPLSSLFVNYYGNEYESKINGNFTNIVYNFDDIFTSSYDILSSNPSIIKGLIDNYGYIKAKEQFNKIFYKHLDNLVNYIEANYNVDLTNNYHIFLNNYFSTEVMDHIIHDDKRLYEYASKNNIPYDKILSIYNIVLNYRLGFYRELLTIDYFKKLYKRLNCEFKVFVTIVKAIFEKEPFVSRFKDRNDEIHNYLYFPYLNYLSINTDVDISLLHELVHLAESDDVDKNIRIGLQYENKNKFVNEIRTDLLAIKLNDKLEKSIFETRDVNYKSIYLKIAKDFIYFFDKYEKVLSKIAISGDLDKLDYLFSTYWIEFSKRLDGLLYEVSKEIYMHPDDKHITVKYNTNKIHELINDMEDKSQNKILVL